MNTLTKHPHADLILERARQDATGETAAGWWKWEMLARNEQWVPPFGAPGFVIDNAYRYNMTGKHPQFKPPKPKLKLVDMAKLPVGSVISGTKYFESATVVGHYLKHLKLLSLEHNGLRLDSTDYLRIAEQKDFTYWGGGDCPMPEGLRVEGVLRSGLTQVISHASGFWHREVSGVSQFDIIAYRITGLAGGWTDNPEDAS